MHIWDVLAERVVQATATLLVTLGFFVPPAVGIIPPRLSHNIQQDQSTAAQTRTKVEVDSSTATTASATVDANSHLDSRTNESGSKPSIAIPAIRVEPNGPNGSQVYIEMNSMLFHTDDWRNFSLVSRASSHGITFEFPTTWKYSGSSYFLQDGTKIAEFGPPGLIQLANGQHCYDNYSETVKTPDPDWGKENLIFQDRISGEGRDMLWVREMLRKTPISIYCVEKNDIAFAMMFYESASSTPADQEVSRKVMNSVDIVDVPNE